MTNTTLDDIRILKLAEMYVRSYQRFVHEMSAQFARDPAVMRHLRRLVDPQEDHAARITQQLARLNASVGPEDALDADRAALLDVVEVERAARKFFLERADAVHDPKVAALFREMAREQAERTSFAEDALAVVMRRSSRSYAPLGP